MVTAQAELPLLRKSDAGRIVNVSNDLGSITRHSDATWKYAQVKLLGYCASKAALNMFTVQLAFELKDQGIAVNSVTRESRRRTLASPIRRAVRQAFGRDATKSLNRIGAPAGGGQGAAPMGPGARPSGRQGSDFAVCALGALSYR